MLGKVCKGPIPLICFFVFIIFWWFLLRISHINVGVFRLILISLLSFRLSISPLLCNAFSNLYSVEDHWVYGIIVAEGLFQLLRTITFRWTPPLAFPLWILLHFIIWDIMTRFFWTFFYHFFNNWRYSPHGVPLKACYYSSYIRPFSYCWNCAAKTHVG